MLREQLQKVLAESPKTTFEKHKIIMKILVELRFELEAKRKEEQREAELIKTKVEEFVKGE